MGLRYRKSIKLGGGFRVNISKSGVGYSWGVPGYRITKTASGKTRKTYSIPGTGISYVDEQGKYTAHGTVPASPSPKVDSPYSDVTDIESADIENFQSAEYSDLLRQINTTILLNKITTWALIISFIMSASHSYYWLLFILSAALKVYLHTKGKTFFEYNIDPDSQKEYEAKTESWKSLKRCQKMWYISQEAAVRNSKTAGGAAKGIERLPLNITHKLPFYIRTNIEPVVLNLKKETIILFPDKVLIVKKSKIGAINYSRIKFDIHATGFIETETPPKDAEFINKVWIKTNKDGSPDMRYKDNKQLPVYKYGYIELSSTEGLNVKLLFSNEKIVESFKLSMGL